MYIDVSMLSEERNNTGEKEAGAGQAVSNSLHNIYGKEIGQMLMLIVFKEGVSLQGKLLGIVNPLHPRQITKFLLDRSKK